MNGQQLALERTDSEQTPLVRGGGSDDRDHPHRHRHHHHHHRHNRANELVENETLCVHKEVLSRRNSFWDRIKSFGAIGAAFLALLLCSAVLVTIGGGGNRGWGQNEWDNGSSSGGSSTKKPGDAAPSTVLPDFLETAGEKLYDELGRYVVEDYDVRPPFSDFLPALAGYYGKPLYAFFVSRGQGIASFGFKSKDYPIMEFESANKAYQMAALVGFRTFLQISRSRRGDDFTVVEPFSPLNARYPHKGQDSNLPKRLMYVGQNDMQLQELDYSNGIETNVTYFVLPEEDFGALVKRTTIRNLNQNKPLTVSMLDGLAKIEPAGGKMFDLLKGIGRTLEGWMGVYQPYDDTITMPYYRLSTQPTDTAEVIAQNAGHWCLSVIEDDEPHLLPIVFDPLKVFGTDSSLIYPVSLYESPIEDIIKAPQYGFAKTASAFGAVGRRKIPPRGSLTISTYYGMADDILDVPVISRRLVQPGFSLYKMMRAREVIKQITASVTVTTAVPLFDGHVQQMFLDNSLRGGISSILGQVDDDARMRNADEDERLKVFHFFSRIHGDLERDYNNFDIAPTFFSEGPVNFRDVIQNRRNDVVFNPSIGAANVKDFLSFIQADGYNPLTIEANILTISDMSTCEEVARKAVGEADGHRAQREALTGLLSAGPFRPGQLFLLMEEQNIMLMISRQEFIEMVVAVADVYPSAVYTSGFWADHWTYYVDLIETYEAIYPDWVERMMFDTELPYFYSPASVKPRKEKYVESISFSGVGKHIRQLDATAEDKQKVRYKKQYIRNTTGWYDFVASWQHNTEGEIFKSPSISKLFMLATLKFATRDAYGMGIEFEAGRPGWDDANNGLVSMLGSGMPETYELIVLLRYIKTTVAKYNRTVTVPTELYDMIGTVNAALSKLRSDFMGDISRADNLGPAVPQVRFVYWDTVSKAREFYRDQTKVTFSGATEPLKADAIVGIVEAWLEEVEDGVQRAHHFGTSSDTPTEVSPTYFYYNITRWTATGKRNSEGHPLVIAEAMEVGTLPLFLEGPMRMLKTIDQRAEARQVYANVRGSPLRDDELKMYTISESLVGQSMDIGRETAFAPGWLENQSVWMHMSYKFYLELLRQGLFDEFFDEMVSGGMLPFIDPNLYGRSLMECSSFIASSAFEDPSVRGRGFLARLSGSTSEFLSMWVLMMIGPKPFFFDKATGLVKMRFLPALPRWIFKDNDDGTARVSFKLFGSIDVTYYHKLGTRNLYRVPPTQYQVGLLDGSVFHIDGPDLPPDLSEKIRRVVFVDSIDVYFQ